jgi:hypothetical protein
MFGRDFSGISAEFKKSKESLFLNSDPARVFSTPGPAPPPLISKMDVKRHP